MFISRMYPVPRMEFKAFLPILVSAIFFSHLISAQGFTQTSSSQPEFTPTFTPDTSQLDLTNVAHFTNLSTVATNATESNRKHFLLEETSHSSLSQTTTTDAAVKDATYVRSTEQTTYSASTELNLTQTTNSNVAQTTESNASQTTNINSAQTTGRNYIRTTENRDAQTTGSNVAQTTERNVAQTTESNVAQTTESNVAQTTQEVNTAAPTTAKPVSQNCMVSRKEEFKRCLESLGANAMKYIASKNLAGFLDDICDSKKSKPHVECIKRHFRECPDFLERPEVTALKFGPYHIKDVHYFDTIDQMCRCSPGLVCINKLMETRQSVKLTTTESGSPWTKMPNFSAICERNTSRYIGCVRQNLRRCQSALNRRYGEDFTYTDAEELKGMYDFTKIHCDTVKDDDFEENYRCVEKATKSPEMNACVRRADRSTTQRKTCEIRECVKEVLEPECDDDMVSLYIDAVNIYTHSDTKLLNYPCSSAVEIAVSVLTVVSTVFIVLVF